MTGWERMRAVWKLSKSGPRWGITVVVLAALVWLSGSVRPLVGHAATSDVERWGNLTVSPLVISPPLEYIPRDVGPTTPARWFFPNATPDSLEQILSAAGFSTEDVSRLVAVARPDAAHGGIVVSPDRQFLRAVDPKVRAKLYLYLAASPLNFDQQSAFRFYTKSIDE